MKSTIFVVLCFLSFLALVEFSRAQDGYQLCNSRDCTIDCYEQGLHGQCDTDDVCRCYNCIYSACRRYCFRQNRIAQCDEAHCMCLQ